MPSDDSDKEILDSVDAYFEHRRHRRKENLNEQVGLEVLYQLLLTVSGGSILALFIAIINSGITLVPPNSVVIVASVLGGLLILPAMLIRHMQFARQALDEDEDEADLRLLLLTTRLTEKTTLENSEHLTDDSDEDDSQTTASLM